MKPKPELTKRWKGFLIDLDGTLYHGTRVIPGAAELIVELNRAHIPFLFVTNNSSRTPAEVAHHLEDMGVPALEEQVCTSAVAAATHIAEENPGSSVAAIGEIGLITALQEAGLKLSEESPDYVVQGIDRSFNYEKLAKATGWINGGAKYILTNPDLRLPTTEGIMPGAGTLSAAIVAATDSKPVIIGKPSAIIMKQAIERLNLEPSEVAVIGDNMLTDIAAGEAAGCGTILTLTGVTTPENIEYYQGLTGIEADVVCKSLDDVRSLITG